MIQMTIYSFNDSEILYVGFLWLTMKVGFNFIKRINLRTPFTAHVQLQKPH